MFDSVNKIVCVLVIFSLKYHFVLFRILNVYSVASRTVSGRLNTQDTKFEPPVNLTKSWDKDGGTVQIVNCSFSFIFQLCAEVRQPVR